MLSLNQFRRQRPLVDCITNTVTINFVANAILAAGGSPVMAEEPQEIDEFTAISSAVMLNIGTAFQMFLPHFSAALDSAKCHGKPVVLDPVGAGASRFRLELVRKLLAANAVAVIRGNASEIRAVAGDNALTARGVDADAGDNVTDQTLGRHLEITRQVAEKFHCVVAQSGAIDIITDGRRAVLCRNGVPQMSQVTGTGCALGGLTAAWCGAFPAQPLEASATAYAMMGLAGERAWQYCVDGHAGTGTLAQRLLDELYLMDDDALQAGGKLEEVAL